jgi:hypothetical protein
MGRLTENQRLIVERLGHPVYTTRFLEMWLYPCENIFANVPAGLQAAKARGFYEAVLALERLGAAPASCCRECLYAEIKDFVYGSCGLDGHPIFPYSSCGKGVKRT